MLIFTTTHNQQVAINPLAISSILNTEDSGENGSPILCLNLINGNKFYVYYADFQALVRIVEEKVK